MRSSSRVPHQGSIRMGPQPSLLDYGRRFPVPRLSVFISSMQSMDNTSVCFCFLYIAHCECVLIFHTSEIFLSVSFLFSSNFRSIPTIPTARVLPAYRTTENSRKKYHPHSLLHAQTISQTYTLTNNKGNGRKGLEWSNLQGLLQATIFKQLLSVLQIL